MDVLFKILVAAFFAMVTMTAFSYAVSTTFRELYKEPVLLQYFLKKTHLKESAELQAIFAWIIHYFIGLGFVVGYHFLWSKQLFDTLLWATFIGTVSGIIGVLGWHLIFNYTRHQPKIDFKGYYLQLIIAHIIFALTAFGIYFYI